MDDGGHRSACYEADPDKAPLEDLCDVCRDTLQGIGERRPLCVICEISIARGELYYLTDIDGEPASNGVVNVAICTACAPAFSDHSGFVGAIA